MLEVLIIDDDDIVIFIQTKMVTNHHLSATPNCFKKASVALKYLRDEVVAENQYLVLLDINMPEMDGWQFLNELEDHPIKNNIHVIMVTSSIDRQDKDKSAKYSSVKGFIEKPISAENCEKLKRLPGITKFF